MTKLSVPVSAKDHRQGEADAPCTLVEYGDYQCPSCGQAYPIVKRVQKHYGKRLSFVFRNFPLTQMHPFAEPAAETAEFAGANGKFWGMHDLIYENQERLGDEELLPELAKQLHLAPAKLLEALESREFEPRVKSDFSSGVRSGVNRTPTFFINGQRHDGPYDFASLVEAIDGALE
jgi:protein-disulfide isomerase